MDEELKFQIIIEVSEKSFKEYNNSVPLDEGRLRDYAEKVKEFVYQAIEDENVAMCESIFIRQKFQIDDKDKIIKKYKQALRNISRTGKMAGEVINPDSLGKLFSQVKRLAEDTLKEE